mgnify:CR=1 FL=1
MTPANRAVSDPYTKLMCANLQVDLAAGLIVTSVAAAQAAHTLGAIGDARATAPLVRGLQGAPPVQRVAIVAALKTAGFTNSTEYHLKDDQEALAKKLAILLEENDLLILTGPKRHRYERLGLAAGKEG